MCDEDVWDELDRMQQAITRLEEARFSLEAKVLRLEQQVRILNGSYT